jgi:cytochrome b involved in lipid metabolism
MSSTITLEELSKHNKEDDLWICINGTVYDVTNFLEHHPGKTGPLLHYAGKDGSPGFNKVHPTMDIFKAMTVRNLGKLETNP